MEASETKPTWYEQAAAAESAKHQDASADAKAIASGIMLGAGMLADAITFAFGTDHGVGNVATALEGVESAIDRHTEAMKESE